MSIAETHCVKIISIISTSTSTSDSTSHLVVIAGVPSLTHDGSSGGRASLGISCLLTLRPIDSRRCSAILPVIPHPSAPPFVKGGLETSFAVTSRITI